MRMTILIITVFFVLTGFVFIKCKSSQDDNQNESQKVNIVHPTENPYDGLRKQMLSVTPEELNLELPKEQEIAFGAVLEIGMESGIATIVSFSTGDASMYTSTGGGIIGGIQHDNVKKAAIDFVSASQSYFSKMEKSSDIPKPKSNHVRFYILTNKGRYTFETPESEATNEKSEWANLFYKGNEVITQLRLTTTNK